MQRSLARLIFKMPSPTKKAKLEDTISDVIKESRSKAGDSIEGFAFNQKRVKFLTGNEGFLRREAKGVAYYMHRDQRLQDNWAALYAQKLALAENLPLYVIAGISVTHPENAGATQRLIDFSLGGLKEVHEECAKLGIEFHILIDDQPMYKRILDFMQKSGA